MKLSRLSESIFDTDEALPDEDEFQDAERTVQVQFIASCPRLTNTNALAAFISSYIRTIIGESLNVNLSAYQELDPRRIETVGDFIEWVESHPKLDQSLADRFRDTPADNVMYRVDVFMNNDEANYWYDNHGGPVVRLEKGIFLFIN